MENTIKKNKHIVEQEITKANGGIALISLLLGSVADIAIFVGSIMLLDNHYNVLGGILLALSILGMVVIPLLFMGLHIVNPNESIVLTLFGKYYGTIVKPGYYFTNPFCACINPAGKTTVSVSMTGGGSMPTTIRNKKISTKIMTLNNEKQKVNDMLGNPIIIGAVVIWKVVDPTKAVFNVENYKTYLSIQCDSTIRNISRLYPYDIVDDSDEEVGEQTLRGSSQEIAKGMTKELQERVEDAGLEILEVRITHLSYAEEIAAAMLQRQQAVAIIAARKKIVEGAVSMVKMAIDQLGEEEIVVLDEERKAAMVSNLLVILCGNKDAQPIVNSGSIY